MSFAQASQENSNTLMKRIAVACLGLATLFVACQSLIQPDYSPERLQEARLGDQVYFEDSASVFFATFTNAFPDKELMWFTVLINGTVEMVVHNTETDSIEAVYRFTGQDLPLHTLACHQDRTRSVKCVLVIDGRRKCARMYPAWDPLPQNWKTQYTIDHPAAPGN